jgi:hypothetical protein
LFFSSAWNSQSLNVGLARVYNYFRDYDPVVGRYAEYANALDYDLFPSFQNSYNSNSYTSGLLDASGIYKIRPPVSTPGWNDPLPPEYFGK